MKAIFRGVTMFEWSDFSNVAKDLSKNTEEEYLRSSIDRHYYSLFGSSREYLIKKRNKYYLKIGGSDIHQKVRDELLNSKDLNENELGEILNELRKLRNKASYDKEYGKEFFEEELNKTEKDIKTAFQSLNYLKNNPSINRWS